MGEGPPRNDQRVMNLSHLVTQAARRYPDRLALIWGEERWTWTELSARADAFAAALVQEFGIRKGDRIIVQSTNSNQMLEAMFACFRVGAIWVPTNFRQTPTEVAQQAQAVAARGMICATAFPQHAADVRTACASVDFVVEIGGDGFGHSYETLIDRYRGRAVAEVAVDYDDPCWFMFTSGSTGAPKAAMMTHGQLAFVINNHLCDIIPDTTEQDAALALAPLSHGAGIHQMLLIARGGLSVLMPSERFSADEAWRLIAQWKVTSLFTVPTILKLLVEDVSVDAHDHSSLRYVVYAGAPMYREDQKRALAVLGPVLVQYYGLVEVTGNITVLPRGHHSADDSVAAVGTCGMPRTGIQVQVQDDDGAEVGAGETGEICVLGPAVFAGYYENPKATAAAFRDGWFRTGDMGHMDERGLLYITGRASDMYISGGSNIYPREIEEKLLEHPGVSEVAVVGLPDPMWGEVGVAVCVRAEGSDVTDSDLNDHLDGAIARYKLPKRFVFWSDLPKSGYGKVTKKLVREQLIAGQE